MNATAPIEEARLVRSLIYQRAACAEWEKHRWVRYVHPDIADFTIVVLCAECGRDPNEALGQMTVR